MRSWKVAPGSLEWVLKGLASDVFERGGRLSSGNQRLKEGRSSQWWKNGAPELVVIILQGVLPNVPFQNDALGGAVCADE